jgi:hypothetical protein
MIINLFRYAYSGQPDKALEYNLRLRRPNVFNLIRDHGLFSAIQDKVLLLMEFDQYLFKEAKKAQDEEFAKLNQDPSKPQVKIKRKKPTDMQAVQLLVENTEHISVRILNTNVSRNLTFEILHYFCYQTRSLMPYVNWKKNLTFCIYI